ncbi:PX domain-containing protein ypt35 [Cadophora gregata]|uniref:PX domain-containing protein ypt35 n=1 Tax=Cadophora gregata TaxID=51156 RepID=UPI0026DCB8DF|nr:PX domain-containing protein ypt35 [Cadophora gregata]KAK0118174.1 PX domain-containing protein ypt35 [Cadophora gregata]KAK0123246.1 PX domain-containing protein ypt35 [Cadophora gregata f. sp. sojae]
MEAILSQQSNHGAHGEPADTRKFGLSTTTTSHDEHEAGDIDSPVTSPVSSPPYWVQSHTRSFSNISAESILAGAITLQDNTDEGDSKNKACWARSVYIEDHVIINGSRTGIGAFVVWNITVETLRGGSMRIRKRYSEFDDLRDKLLQTFPNSKAAMPPLPPKSVISKFRPKFLENRRSGLQYFLNCILLNPEFSGSPVLKEFLFS